jgi:D(-)-tartrate dehydratase
VRVYGAGGNVYPADDDCAFIRGSAALYRTRLHTRQDQDWQRGGLSQDQKRIETAAKQLRGAAHLAVDAIYAYDAKTAPAAASMLAPFGLWWFERTPGAAKQGPKVAGCTRAQPMLAAESQL